MGYAVDVGAAMAVCLLAEGESGLLVGRRQHDMFARVCTCWCGWEVFGACGKGGHRTVRRHLLVQRQKEEEDEDAKDAEEAEEER